MLALSVLKQLLQIWSNPVRVNKSLEKGRFWQQLFELASISAAMAKATASEANEALLKLEAFVKNSLRKDHVADWLPTPSTQLLPQSKSDLDLGQAHQYLFMAGGTITQGLKDLLATFNQQIDALLAAGKITPKNAAVHKANVAQALQPNNPWAFVSGANELHNMSVAERDAEIQVVHDSLPQELQGDFHQMAASVSKPAPEASTAPAPRAPDYRPAEGFEDAVLVSETVLQLQLLLSFYRESAGCFHTLRSSKEAYCQEVSTVAGMFSTVNMTEKLYSGAVSVLPTPALPMGVLPDSRPSLASLLAHSVFAVDRGPKQSSQLADEKRYSFQQAG